MKKEDAMVPVPKIGSDIYVPTSLYMDHGRDDVVGGLAKVTSVKPGISGGKTVSFVTVAEIPDSFNWEQYLAPMQDKLKKEFGANRARPDPDNRQQFNKG